MAGWTRQQLGTLEYSVAWLGSIVVVELEGRLTVEADPRPLVRLITWVARQGDTDVVLDLQHVRALDCAGIGLLMRARHRLSRHGGALVLANVERRARYLLELAGLRALLPVFDGRGQAVAWCRRSTASDFEAREIPVACLAPAESEAGYVLGRV